MIDLILDKEDRVSEVAQVNFLSRALSRAEVERLKGHPEERIRNVLQEHDRYLEYSGTRPASARLETDRPLVEGREGVLQVIIKEMEAETQERTGRRIFLQLHSIFQEPDATQIAAAHDLWYICLKPGKTAREYWTLLNAIKETDNVELASEIAYRFHKELFIRGRSPY